MTEPKSTPALCQVCGYQEINFRHWQDMPNHIRHTFTPPAETKAGPLLSSLEALSEWLESDDREATGETLDKAAEKVRGILELAEAATKAGPPLEQEVREWWELFEAAATVSPERAQTQTVASGMARYESMIGVKHPLQENTDVTIRSEMPNLQQQRVEVGGKGREPGKFGDSMSPVRNQTREEATASTSISEPAAPVSPGPPNPANYEQSGVGMTQMLIDARRAERLRAKGVSAKGDSPLEPVAELIEVRIKSKGRHEEFACLMGYQPPEGTEVVSRRPLYLTAEGAKGDREAQEIVIAQIASSTGPTGGWLDSPKAVCAAIVAALDNVRGHK